MKMYNLDRRIDELRLVPWDENKIITNSLNLSDMRVYQTNEIKNIALVGSAGSGKTTLAESMLFEAGVIKRRGSVEAKILLAIISCWTGVWLFSVPNGIPCWVE